MNPRLKIHPVSIAPMVRYSTRAMRYLWRQLSSQCLLYTEMITAISLLKGDCEKLLAYSPCEKPLALQIADNSLERLSMCARIAEEHGFDEINLNIGCPSSAAVKGGFGACLMREPHLIAECVAAMAQATKIPVTIKTRLGVDTMDSFAEFQSFVHKLAMGGTAKLIVHARKALLNGFTPKSNRTVPPLKHEWVYEAKKSFPHLSIVLNGGICSLSGIEHALKNIDGVMIGRAAYQNPMFVQQIARSIYKEQRSLTREELLGRMLAYAEKRYKDDGESFRHTGRHLLNLYQGMPEARNYRREMTLRLRNPHPPSLRMIHHILPSV